MRPQYGEPWRHTTDTCAAGSGGGPGQILVVAHPLANDPASPRLARDFTARLVACVNALTGVPDATVRAFAAAAPLLDDTLRQLALAVLAGDASAAYPLADRLQETTARPAPAACGCSHLATCKPCWEAYTRYLRHDNLLGWAARCPTCYQIGKVMGADRYRCASCRD